MNKPTKNILIVLFILAVAGVMAGGLVLIFSAGQPTSQKEEVKGNPNAPLLNPENQIDVDVRLSGRSFTDQEVRENGAITGTYHNTFAEYMDEEGNYQPIDTTVVESTGDYKYENTTNVHRTHFKEEAGLEEAVTFEVAGERGISLSFIDSQSAQSSAQGSTVTYAGVYEGVDVEYTVVNDALHEKIILKQKTDKDRFSQKMKLTDIYYKEQQDGSLTFHDQKTKRIVFLVPQPYMYEQNGETKINYGVEYEITRDGDNYIISKVITESGQAWLEQASYPVVIDPSIALPTTGINFTSLPPTIESNYIGPGWQPQILELTFEDQTTGEHGWLVQYSPTGLSGSWLDLVWMPTGFDETDSWSYYLYNAYGHIGGINRQADGLYTVAHRLLGYNEQYYYRIVPVQWIMFGNGGKVILRDGNSRTIDIFGDYIYPAGLSTEKYDKLDGNQEAAYIFSNSVYSLTVANDGTDNYLYEGGSSTIRKRALNDLALDTGFSGDGKTYVDVGYYSALTTDNTYIYGATSRHYITKNRLDDGSFDADFAAPTVLFPDGGVLSKGGVGGIPQLVSDTNSLYYAVGASVDGAGYLDVYKHHKSDGTLCETGNECDGFAFSGDGRYYNFDWDELTGMAIDSGYIYLLGNYPNDGWWTVQRMQKSTGSNIYRVSSGASGETHGMAIDTVGGHLYIVGDDGNGFLRLEKRDTGNLSLVGSYVSDATDNLHVGRSIVLDPGTDGVGYLYVTTYEGASDSKTAKFKMSDLSLDNVTCTNSSCMSFNDGDYALVSQSEDSEKHYRYTLAAPVTEPPTVNFYGWGEYEVSVVPDRDGDGLNPTGTKYCVSSYYEDSMSVTPSTERRYLSGPMIYPPVNSTPPPRFTESCRTAAEWAAIPQPFTRQGGKRIMGYHPEGIPLGANIFYETSVYSINEDGYLTEPEDLVNDVVSGWTRARVPSSPILSDVEPTSINMEMNKIHSYSPSSYENPDWTDYLTEVKTYEGDGITLISAQYVDPSNPSAPSDLPVWCDYEDGTGLNYEGCDWNGTDGVNLTFLNANLCYEFRSQARNEGNIIGGGDGECASDSSRCQFDVDCPSSTCVMNSEWSATVSKECTPPVPADPPTVDCHFEIDSGDPEYEKLVCDVTINDSENSGDDFEGEYKIEYCLPNVIGADCSDSGASWQTATVPEWTSAYGDGDTVPFVEGTNGWVDCIFTQNITQSYRVIAKNTLTGQISAPSGSTIDYLPPCVPENFDCSDPLMGISNVTWTWSDPLGGLTPDKYYIYGEEGVGSYPMPYLTEQNNGALSNESWHQNPLYPYNQLRSAYIRSVSDPAYGAKESEWSNIPADCWTHALRPTISVSCNDVSMECTVQVGRSDINGQNSDSTLYYLETSSDGVLWNQGFTACVGQDYTGWKTYAELGAGVMCFSGGTCNSTNYFRVKAKNGSDIETDYSLPDSDTLPPCPPENLRHTQNTLNSIRWAWDAGDGEAPDYYEIYNADNGALLRSNITNLYWTQTTGTNERWRVKARAVDNINGSSPFSNVAQAYSSIEPVTGITFNGWQTDTLAFRADPQPSNLGSGSSGVRFRETTGTGWTASWGQSNNASHSSCNPNTQYCYQGQTRNGDADLTAWGPADPGDCTYTHAVTPDRPSIQRLPGGESVRLILRTADDDNPGYTQYAICVTRYNEDGSQDEKYAFKDDNNDGDVTVDWSGGNCAEANSTGHWATREPDNGLEDWGGTQGIIISGLDSSTKYDFKVKAKNESTIWAGNGQNWTNFGPPATLFLVRNNVVGWAWSSKIGWVSMNCLNQFADPSLGYSCGVANDWGLNTDFEAGREINPLEGFAWSASGQALGERWSDPEKISEYSPATTNDYLTADKNVAIDSSGQPHIVWAEAISGSDIRKEIYYQKWDGNNNNWVDTGGTPGAKDNLSNTPGVTSVKPSLVLDNNGYPHVAWTEGTSIYYLKWDGNNWVDVDGGDQAIINVTASVGSGNGLYPSLQVDESNNPHIAWEDMETNEQVVYSQWNGGEWVPADGTADPDRYDIVSNDIYRPNPSLDIASGTGFPHIAWKGGEPTDDIFYLKWDGSNWVDADGTGQESSKVNGTTTRVGSASIVLGSDNNPHIAWGSNYNAYYIKWNGSTWVGVDGVAPANNSPNYEPFTCTLGVTMSCDARSTTFLRLDQQDEPHILTTTGRMRYRHWDSGAGDWVTASNNYGADDDDLDLFVSASTDSDFSIGSFDLDQDGNPHVLMTHDFYGSQSVYYSRWDEGITKAGLGWISLNQKACFKDPQVGCIHYSGCEGNSWNGNPCQESAGTSPGGISYGYCYDANGVSGQRYGACSDDSSGCTETDLSLCLDQETAVCILETCKTGDTCSDVGAGTEECRATATANFNGITQEIEGWARVLAQKKAGQEYDCDPITAGLQPCDDWGWIKLGGQYDDEQGTTGNYTITGTEVDSQQFLGDPDVNPDDVKLYSMFGWGWVSETSDYSSSSQWLNPTNISLANTARYSIGQGKEKDLVIDSEGDPHVIWSNYEATNSHYEIYYLKLKAGQWITANGTEYRPGAIDPYTTGLNISNTARTSTQDSRFPSLVLDTADNPYVVWQEGGSAFEGGSGLYFSRWDNNSWASAVQVEGGPSQSPVLKRDPSGVLHVAYRVGVYYYGDIYYKKSSDNGVTWETVTGDGNNLDVSNTPLNTAQALDLAVSDDGTPYITWMGGGGHIFHRWWNGSGWVTASEDAGSLVCSNNFLQSCTVATEQAVCGWYCPIYANNNAGGSCSVDTDCGTGTWARCLHNVCQSVDVSVNWGVRTCGGGIGDPKCRETADCGAGICQGIGNSNQPDSEFNGQVPKIALFSDGSPGVAWRDPTTLLFRRWSGVWESVDFTDQPDDPDLVVAPQEAEANHDLFIDENDKPHLVWDYKPLGASTDVDIYYSSWNGTNWITADKFTEIDTGDRTLAPSTANFNVSQTPDVESWIPVFGFDEWGNPHVVWNETEMGGYCGAFDSDGVVDEPLRAAPAETILDAEGQYLYVVGSDDVDDNGNTSWRIEKRRTDDGLLCTAAACGTAFDSDGIIRYDTDGSNIATDIALDLNGEYLYVVGRSDSGRDMRIQKHRTDDGLLCTAAACGTAFDGDGIIEVSGTGTGTGNHSNVSVEVDANYMYVAGTDDSDDWHIEKRQLDDGSLVTGFGTGGVVASTDGYGAQWITIDTEFMYVIGGNDDNDWRIEKRRLDSGSLVAGFGSGGIINGSGSYDSEKAFQTLLYGDYLYVVGNTDDTSEEDFLVAKYDRYTGQPVSSFGGDGFMQISDFQAEKAFSIAADDNYIYIVGYTGSSKWRYERLSHDGSRPSGTYNGGWQDGIIFEDGNNGHGDIDGRIDSIVIDDTYMYAVGSHELAPSTWRIEKRWLTTGELDSSESFDDCTDPDYPQCLNYWVSASRTYWCFGSNINYSRWSPGVVQGDIGWLEFMPAGALMGIPWVQTMYSDIYASETIQLAPPPRGSGQHTATYLILADGSIRGLTDISRPTSAYYEPGLDSLIEEAGLPFGENALARINVEALRTTVDGTRNRYGHEVVSQDDTGQTSVDISANFSDPLGGKIYYFNGADSYTVDNEIIFKIGDAATSGAGTVIIDGDLEVNANVLYEQGDLSAVGINAMPSVAFIVEGDTYVNSMVSELSGVFVAKGDEGVISTSRKKPVYKTVSLSADDAYVEYNPQGPGYTSYIDAASLRFGRGEEEIIVAGASIDLSDNYDIASVGSDSAIPRRQPQKFDYEQAIVAWFNVPQISVARDEVEITEEVYDQFEAEEPARVITKLKPISGEFDIGEQQLGDKKYLANYQASTVTENELEQLLASADNIEAVHLDQPVSLLLTEAIPLIRADFSDIDIEATGTGQKICLIDTGVDYNHPAITNYVAGYDFINNDADPLDDHGHGTSVAGVISAIAPDSQLYVAKVIDDQGVGYESTILQGLQWCLDQSVDVINFSIGSGDYNGFCDDNPVAQFVNEIVLQGIFVSAATGNDGVNTIKAPSCAMRATRVSATDKSDNIADFANISLVIDLLAPGSEVEVPALDGGTAEKSGTSISAPMVSAGAALLLENESLSPLDMKYRLRSTGQPIEYTEGEVTIDISRLDIYNAALNNITMTPYDYGGEQGEGTEGLYQPLSGVGTACGTFGNEGCNEGLSCVSGICRDCDYSSTACGLCCTATGSALCPIATCISGTKCDDTLTWEGGGGDDNCCGDDAGDCPVCADVGDSCNSNSDCCLGYCSDTYPTTNEDGDCDSGETCYCVSNLDRCTYNGTEYSVNTYGPVCYTTGGGTSQGRRWRCTNNAGAADWDPLYCSYDRSCPTTCQRDWQPEYCSNTTAPNSATCVPGNTYQYTCGSGTSCLNGVCGSTYQCSTSDNCSGNTRYAGLQCGGDGINDCSQPYTDIGCCQCSKCVSGQYCATNYTCQNLPVCTQCNTDRGFANQSSGSDLYSDCGLVTCSDPISGYIYGWGTVETNSCRLKTDADGYCDGAGGCETPENICLAHTGEDGQSGSALCGSAACKGGTVLPQPACVTDGTASFYDEVGEVCYTNANTAACPDVGCTTWVRGWSGTTCQAYSLDSTGYCDATGTCDTSISVCEAVAGQGGADLASCGSASCQMACPAGGTATSYDEVSEVCYTNINTAGCTDVICSSQVKGWSGTTCQAYSLDSSGYCDASGMCDTSTTACEAVAGQGTADLASCGSAACQMACPAGGTATSYDEVSEICYTSGQQGCAANEECDATGTCQLMSGVSVDISGDQTSTIYIPSYDQHIGGAFTIASTAGSNDVTSITITENGTVDGFNDLGNIKLYYETAADCDSTTYADGVDGQFGATTGFSADNGTASFNGSVGIDVGLEMCVYAVLDVGTGALDNQTLNIFINNPSTDVTVSTGSVAPATPVGFATTVTLDDPTIAGTTSDSQIATIYIPADDQYIGGAFTVASKFGNRNVTSIKLTETGTVDRHG